MAPFRELLSKKNGNFYWDDALNILFEESKEKIVSKIKDGVHSFEINRPTCVSTDWSKIGLGYTLSQKHCNCPEPFTPNCGDGHWRTILIGSRFTKPAESRYAPIEGEALAVLHGLQQCRLFTLGCPNLIVATDHKPLTKILNAKPLDAIENPRLLRIKEKTMLYDYKIVHVPGKSHMAPDAASRYPTKSNLCTFESCYDEADLEECSKAYAITQSASLPSCLTWDDINDEASVDCECIALKEVIENGFPKSREELPEMIRYFWSMQEDLYVIDNVPFKGKKMLIPKKLRPKILDGLHAAHQGVTSMKLNARERMFWPGLDADINQKMNQCQSCNENAPSQAAEQMLTTQIPSSPFEKVVTDLFDVGSRKYLVYADRYSGWTEVVKSKDGTFRSIEKNFMAWFATHGLPEEISSDGGPPFNSSNYSEFLRSWKISPRLSSAHYPQSNGRAEVAVKTIKRILRGNVNPLTGDVDTRKAICALMSHRNTPHQDSGLSPAEMLYGC